MTHRAFAALVALPLVAALTPATHAGDQVARCLAADLSYDGRYVLMRPDCEVEAVYDLHTRQLVRGAAAAKLATTNAWRALAAGPADGAFGAWLNKAWDHDGVGYRWLSHALPGTPWLLRYKVQLYHWEDRSPIIGAPQLAPRALFEAFFAAQSKADPTLPLVYPVVAPLVPGKAADVAALFQPTTPTKKPPGKKTKVVAFTYDAAAFARAVPTFGDLVAHAPLTWKEVTSEANTTGWVLGDVAPGGLWATLGAHAKTRVVDAAGQGAYFGIEALHAALVAGRATDVTLFEPYTWTLVELVPR